ncbi:hypothetical protein INR49_009322 [Caranx melampygus]|nr:hypothetical protein INR49_009322 [Caranx melampygus]
MYIFQLLDYYGSTRACHYCMALSECLALAWGFDFLHPVPGWLHTPQINNYVTLTGLMHWMDHDSLLCSHGATVGSWTDVFDTRNLQRALSLLCRPAGDPVWQRRELGKREYKCGTEDCSDILVMQGKLMFN